MIRWKVQRNPIEDTYIIRASKDGLVVRTIIDGNVKSLAQTRPERKAMVAMLRNHETTLLSRMESKMKKYLPYIAMAPLIILLGGGIGTLVYMEPMFAVVVAGSTVCAAMFVWGLDQLVSRKHD